MTKITGRKADILVSLLPKETEMGDLDFDRIIAYADTGLLKAFLETEGIMNGDRDRGIPNRYILLIDPRYDTQWVIEEVKATAMIALPERKSDESEK